MNTDFKSVLLSIVESGGATDVIEQIYEDVFDGTFVDLCMYEHVEDVLDESSANYSSPRLIKEKYGNGVSIMLGDVEYRYTSDEYSAEDLLKKIEGIMRHQGTGQIKKWLDRHALKYWDSKRGDAPAVQTSPEDKKTLSTYAKVEGDKFTLTINGKKYAYEADGMTAEDLKKKYWELAKTNRGQAIAWLKKNCKPATRLNESGFHEIVDPEEELRETLKEGSIVTVNGVELLIETCNGTDLYVVDAEDKRFVVNIFEAADVDIYEAILNESWESGFKKALASFKGKMSDYRYDYLGSMYDCGKLLTKNGRDWVSEGVPDRKFLESAISEATKLLAFYNKSIKSRVDSYKKDNPDVDEDVVRDHEDDLEALKFISTFNPDKSDLKRLSSMF